MTHKRTLYALVLPAAVLLVPFTAMRLTDEVQWTASDFLVAWVLMAGVGLCYVALTARARGPAYRGGAALGLVTGFMLVWGNLAVGFIGSEDNPANLLYAGVLLVGAIGACLARFRPSGLARALVATAVAQALVPFVAYSIWRPELTVEVAKVVVLNSFFAALFLGSALLFRKASGEGAQVAG